MDVGRGRELVGVVIIDLVLTAPVLRVDVYQEADGLFTYKPVITGFFALDLACRKARQQLSPGVKALWKSEAMHAYYIQLVGRWAPMNVCEGADWWDVTNFSK